MKIKEYDYRGRADDSIAGFAVEFYKRFWDSLPMYIKLKLMDSYHEINRALGDTIRNRVQILGCRYDVSNELIKQFGEAKADEQAEYNLARKIADELMKTEAISLQKGKHWRLPITEYEVSIPFIMINEAIK